MKKAFANSVIREGVPENFEEAPRVREANLVGFEDETATLRRYLTTETNYVDVISITGMPGLGKTTLAGMIYRHEVIQHEFPTRIWVYVSPDFTTKRVLLAILKGSSVTITQDMYDMSTDELARLVGETLDGLGKFLLVLDDVWNWEKFEIALPKSNTNGKILITCRDERVARVANRNREPHRLRFLTADESFSLLKLEVFRTLECPTQLLDFGRTIAHRCNGLPIAIVVIGGILVKKFLASNEMIAKRNSWRKVSESVMTYLNEDSEKLMKNIIAMSYDKLPYHLRMCFLYFSMFPDGHEIRVWNLIRIWIGEGLVQHKDASITLEETAENYLEELMNRNLVRYDKIKSNGKVKTVRIHDMLRDFCRTKAMKENFLQEMKRHGDGVFRPRISDTHNYRRLCIHSHVQDFLAAKPYGPRVRSLVCFSEEEIILKKENVSAITESFKLLRILDVLPLKFNKIPDDIYHLVQLKYISLSLNVAVIPEAFSKLLNIETFVVNTNSPTLEIKADIWKMIQLRHVKTNASTSLPEPSKSSSGGENLKTLGTISPKSCTEKVFGKACNLNKLGIRGRLALFIDGTIGSFDSLPGLGYLEKLKLQNDVFPGQLQGLPQPYKFPPKLRSLTLAGTYLNWGHISILGSLENLEVLKLKDNAFVGDTWTTSVGGFPQLLVLHIGSTDLANWIDTGHNFPSLGRLELHDCEKLQRIPMSLATIPSFQRLDLRNSGLAVACAVRIRQASQGRLELTSS